MRDQATSPEFLYLSIALNVEIHNRLAQWAAALERMQKSNQLTQEGPPREFLYARLRTQEEEVQGVFGSFRHPKGRSSQTTSVAAQLQDARETKKDAPKKEAKKPAAKKSKRERDKDMVADVVRKQVVKFAVLAAVSVLSFGYVLISTGTVEVVGTAEAITREQAAALSPVIAFAAIDETGKTLRGRLVVNWPTLDPRARKDAASAIAKGLAQYHVPNAELLDYKTVAIRIEQNTVSFVDLAKRGP
jgi:hypothetical protein